MSEPTADRSPAADTDRSAVESLLTLDAILSAELRRFPLMDLGLELTELSARQADELGADAIGAMDDRQVVVRAIARQVTLPSGTTIADVDAWDDERLQTVLRRMLAQDDWLKGVDPATATFSSFRGAVRRETEEFTARMNKALAPMLAMAKSARQYAGIANGLSDLRQPRVGLDALRTLERSTKALRAEDEFLRSFQAGHGFSGAADALFDGRTRRPVEEAVLRLSATPSGDDAFESAELHAQPTEELVSATAVSVGLELVGLATQDLDEAKRRRQLSEDQGTKLGDLIQEARSTTRWAKWAAVLAAGSLVVSILALLWR